MACVYATNHLTHRRPRNIRKQLIESRMKAFKLILLDLFWELRVTVCGIEPPHRIYQPGQNKFLHKKKIQAVWSRLKTQPGHGTFGHHLPPVNSLDDPARSLCLGVSYLPHLNDAKIHSHNEVWELYLPILIKMQDIKMLQGHVCGYCLPTVSRLLDHSDIWGHHFPYLVRTHHWIWSYVRKTECLSPVFAFILLITIPLRRRGHCDWW